MFEGVIVCELFVLWEICDGEAADLYIVDIDNWIVDEEGRPINRGKKKKHIIHDDA